MKNAGTLPETSNAPFYDYKAYGLVFRSDFALPELVATDTADAVPDVVIRRGRIERPQTDEPVAFDFTADSQRLVWQSVGAFHVEGGRTITVDPLEGLSDDMISFPLLGPVLALLLAERGYLVLHASAVARDGRCVVFMGDKGAGKSTTTATFVKQGWSMLTDDLVAIRFDEELGPVVLPGFPQIKLDRATTETFETLSTEKREAPHAHIDKIRFVLSDRPFSGDAVPLKSLFFLSRGAALARRPLTPPEALQAILYFSYGRRFAEHALKLANARTHLQTCARLVAGAEVAELTVPDTLEALQTVPATIREWLSAGQAPGAAR